MLLRFLPDLLAHLARGVRSVRPPSRDFRGTCPRHRSALSAANTGKSNAGVAKTNCRAARPEGHHSRCARSSDTRADATNSEIAAAIRLWLEPPPILAAKLESIERRAGASDLATNDVLTESTDVWPNRMRQHLSRRPFKLLLIVAYAAFASQVWLASDQFEPKCSQPFCFDSFPGLSLRLARLRIPATGRLRHDVCCLTRLSIEPVRALIGCTPDIEIRFAPTPTRKLKLHVWHRRLCRFSRSRTHSN